MSTVETAAPSADSTPKSLFRWVEFLANCAVAAGIVFGVVQLRQSAAAERRLTTLDLLRPIRSVDCLKAMRLLRVQREAKAEATAETVDALDIAINAYEPIAIYYAAGHLDGCLVKAHVGGGLDEAIDDLEFFGIREEDYRRLSIMRTDLRDLSCNDSD